MPAAAAFIAEGGIMKTVKLTTERGTALLHALQEDPAYQPWNVYPRPQLRRESYVNLNGWWDFGTEAAPARGSRNDPEKRPAVGAPAPEAVYDRRILVPFPVESALSGVGEHFPEGSRLWYRRRFVIGALPVGERLLLHIDGVDQTAEVLLNGVALGSVCTALNGPETLRLDGVRQGENVLELCVRDDLRDRAFPYGKQTRNRGGMWYTPVSGIWRSVWLEWVPERYVTALLLAPTLTEVTIRVLQDELPAVGEVFCEGKRFPLVDGQAIVRPDDPKLWTPETPHLYEFTVKTETDEVRSYFALRTVECKTVDGAPRICLNGKPYFFHALLDQGFWPDGISTPAAPECYADEILSVKRLGFNTLRKHIKIESAQFYYDCDRLGMLVMQDMVNNGRYSFLGDTLLPTLGLQRLPDRLPLRRRATRAYFRRAMASTVRQLGQHPCVVYWTIFNEGWGQFRASENYALLRSLDPTRIIDTSSGWFRGGTTDVESRHVYFRRFRLPNAKKPVVLSEFGGYVCKLAGHCFHPEKSYGYRFFEDRAAWMDALERLYLEQIVPAIPRGLCGAVYTQLSDVEDETNGLVTYDRRVCKADEARMQSIAAQLQTKRLSG